MNKNILKITTILYSLSTLPWIAMGQDYTDNSATQPKVEVTNPNSVTITGENGSLVINRETNTNYADGVTTSNSNTTIDAYDEEGNKVADKDISATSKTSKDGYSSVSMSANGEYSDGSQDSTNFEGNSQDGVTSFNSSNPNVTRRINNRKNQNK